MMVDNMTLNLLRIVTGFLLLQHGMQKLFGLLGREAVALNSLSGVAGVLEFFGGAAILIGLATRPIAFLLSGLLAAAYFMAHAGEGFWPIQNGGELAALYSFVFLYLSARGGGEFSIDGWLKTRR
ncbi:MAG: DoxX family protein [Solibacterales bacterium]|nr:DoxX family protein [Bryobacterales bacterium]|tara:strand:+ start:6448 stop:6822 length:375 start_codon:yes stop_codon:yes gene_type:complete